MDKKAYKTFKRYCLKLNQKLNGMKKCFLCEVYKQKNDNPEILKLLTISKLKSNSAGLIGHLKYNSCKYASNLDITNKTANDKIIRDKHYIKPLKNILFNTTNASSKMQIEVIKQHWSEIMGKKHSKTTAPKKIYRNILYIIIENSMLFNELNFLFKEILENIKKFIPETNIKKIKLVLT